MICPFCHQETGDGNFFCSRCGADLRKASKPVTLDAAPGPADQGASPSEEPKTGQKPKSRICAWVVLGVVVLASAVLVIKMVMAEAARQRVEESDLRYIVKTIDNSEALIEDYFDDLITGWDKTYSNSGAANRSVDLGVKANKAVREMIFTSSSMRELRERKGWDPATYAAYEELWDAYNELCEFFDDYDGSDHQAVRDTYESLRSDYRACRDRLP